MRSQSAASVSRNGAQLLAGAAGVALQPELLAAWSWLVSSCRLEGVGAMEGELPAVPGLRFGDGVLGLVLGGVVPGARWPVGRCVAQTRIPVRVVMPGQRSGSGGVAQASSGASISP